MGLVFGRYFCRKGENSCEVIVAMTNRIEIPKSSRKFCLRTLLQSRRKERERLKLNPHSSALVSVVPTFA